MGRQLLPGAVEGLMVSNLDVEFTAMLDNHSEHFRRIE